MSTTASRFPGLVTSRFTIPYARPFGFVDMA
jgi:hypothetical protein